MTACVCMPHAAKRRPLGCKMFRKLATTKVATGQLAAGLKPQAALLLLYFFSPLSVFSSDSSTSFANLSGASSTVTVSLWHLVGAFMSYLHSPSSQHQTNTYHKHQWLCMYRNTAKHQEFTVKASRHIPLPSCPSVNYTHTHIHKHLHTNTLMSFLFFITHILEDENEEKKERKTLKHQTSHPVCYVIRLDLFFQL